MPRTHHLRVAQLSEPIRLDRYVASLSELGLSRTQVEHLIDAGHLFLEGKVATAKRMLRGGEEIHLTIPDSATALHITPEAIPLDVVYEDEFLAVVNKAVGMVTHPGAGVHSGTLVNALLHRFGTLPLLSQTAPDDPPDDDEEISPSDAISQALAANRPGLVHRLDKNTSGLLLVARTEQVLRSLQEQMARREIHREYLALVIGNLAETAGTIEAPIGRSPRDRKKMGVVANGREAITHYEMIERFTWADLLRVNLQTGRTHQIRVHLSYIKHPIFGDPEYGGREQRSKGLFATHRAQAMRLLHLLPAQALHAAKLSFIHPVKKTEMVLEASIPEQFEKVLEDLRKTAKA